MVSSRPKTEGISQHAKNFLSQFPLLAFARKHLAHLAFNVWLVISPNKRRQLFRKMRFEITKADALVVSTSRDETFVISSSDMDIGRYTYINREPYDFDRVEKVFALLGHRRPKTLLIDIGANIGTICIPAVKRGLFTNAIAIEPDPLNYSLLLANINLNGLRDKIVAHNLALGQKDDEQLAFELSKTNFGDHRVQIRNDFDLYDEAGRKVITVKSQTFDNVVKSVEPNETLIWIDTQGFEGHILCGAKKALHLQTPICCEFWPYGMHRSNCYPLFKKSLIQAGYNLFYDLNEGQSPIPFTSKSLDDLYERLGDRGAYTELLVLKVDAE